MLAERWKVTVNYGDRVEVHRDLLRRDAERLAQHAIATAICVHAEPQPARVRGEGSYR